MAIMIVSRLEKDDKTHVYSWGSGTQGQLGLGTEQQSLSLPQEVTSLLGEGVNSISSFGDVSGCLTSQGIVYTWGRTKVTAFYC